MSAAHPATGTTRRVLLRDGTPVEVRALRADDGPALERLHRDLPERDRWLRFATTSPAGLAEYAADAAASGDVWGAFYGAELVGAVHVAPTPSSTTGEGAEVALAVEHRMQDHGVGTALLEHAVRESRRRGLRRWSAEVLTENATMLRVFADLGLPVARELDGPCVHVVCDLNGADGRFEGASLSRVATATRAGLDPVLRPAAVAVVGAGRGARSVGRAVLAAIRAGGFAGPLHAVHPELADVDGVPAVRTLDDLPQVPELVVLATPPASLPALVEACGRRGVRAVLVVTSGLAAAGVDDAVRASVRRHGMRLVGPNCLGIVNSAPTTALDATFARGRSPAGRVGVVTQSGGVAVAVLATLRELGLGVSTLVSVGDRYDVSSNDLLAWWSRDDDTQVAVLHVESFGNPRAFSRLARRLSARMPVLAVRAAGSAAGARAAASHTAAAATPAVRRDALYRQAGIQAVDDLGALAGALAVLAWSPPAAGDRIAVLGNAGGTNVLAADACERVGLHVPTLAAATREALAALLPTTAAVAGPVDTTAIVDPEVYAGCLRVLLAAPEIDAVLSIACPTALGDPGTGLAEVLDAAAKPVVAVSLDQPTRVRAVEGVHGAPRAAAFADPADAVLALDHLVQRGRALTRPAGESLAAVEPPLDLTAITGVVAAVLREAPTGRWLAPAECAAVLGAAGLEFPAATTARTAPDAVAAARAVGGPVAIKAIADGLVHKSERGGVVLDVVGDASVTAAVEQFADRFGPALRGVLVQPMVPTGVEMLVGVAGDAEFGALVTAGVGGTGTDLADRRWHRLVPMTTTDLAELLDDLPLERGIAARLVDRDRLGTVIARVARLAELVPQIAEMDLNPVVCTPASCRVVDARIRVAPAAVGPSGAEERS